MGRKATWLDEEGIKRTDKVIYCFTPWERPDKDGNFVFKCGRSRYFGKRLETFHTDFLDGVYFLRILVLDIKERTSVETIKSYTTRAEHELFKILIANGAKRLSSKTRIRNEGETEWFYGNMQCIRKSFDELNDKYAGELHKYYYTTKTREKEFKKNKEGNYVGEYITELVFV